MERQRASIITNHKEMDEVIISSQYRSKTINKNTSKILATSKKFNLLDKNLR